MESTLCDAYNLHVVSLLVSTLLHGAVHGFVPSGSLYFFTGVQRARCPACGMVCSHSSMVASGQESTMNAENFYHMKPLS